MKAEIIKHVGSFEVVRITGIRKPKFGLGGPTWKEAPDLIGYWPAGSTVEDLYPTTALRECGTVREAIESARLEQRSMENDSKNPEGD